MPEPSMPEQPVPQLNPEVVQTPRQRVEASLRKQRQTSNDLFPRINQAIEAGLGARGGLPVGELAEKKRLEQQLVGEIEAFKVLVNNIPEAQAWVEIEEEELIRATKEGWGKGIMSEAIMDYARAKGNLMQVEKGNASVSTVPK